MPGPAAAPLLLGAATLGGAYYFLGGNNRRRSSASSVSSDTSSDLKTYSVNYQPNEKDVQKAFPETHPQYGKDMSHDPYEGNFAHDRHRRIFKLSPPELTDDILYGSL
ncbi:hypothetical protein HDV00_006200 [Rhizophlyctis rosea]|nr:hypothetical protein HDV00_006200 [Rhizophlyctis rosea]